MLGEAIEGGPIVLESEKFAPEVGQDGITVDNAIGDHTELVVRELATVVIAGGMPFKIGGTHGSLERMPVSAVEFRKLQHICKLNL